MVLLGTGCNLWHHSIAINQLWSYVTPLILDSGSLHPECSLPLKPSTWKTVFCLKLCCQLLSAYLRIPKPWNESHIISDRTEYCTSGGWKWDILSRDCLQRLLFGAETGRFHAARKHTIWPHNYIFINNSFDTFCSAVVVICRRKTREEMQNCSKNMGGLVVLCKKRLVSAQRHQWPIKYVFLSPSPKQAHRTGKLASCTAQSHRRSIRATSGSVQEACPDWFLNCQYCWKSDPSGWRLAFSSGYDVVHDAVGVLSHTFLVCRQENSTCLFFDNRVWILVMWLLTWSN